MSRLTLRLRLCPRQRIDLAQLTPDRLAGLTPAEIRAIPLWAGNQWAELGEFFDVQDGDAEEILIQSDSDRLDGIGTGMTGGSIRIEGRAGAYLGRAMRGGEIRVAGDSGIFAGTGMSGGTLRIDGNAGDFLGAAMPGERRGMRGGCIEVRGNAGDRAGDHQRRGTILIAGDAGDYCGSRMVAGTLLVLGRAGAQSGFAMRRGTLIVGVEPDLPPTFNDNGVQTLGFLSLLTRSLQALGAPFDGLGARGARVRRWVGDLGYGGQGEVLAWVE